MTIALAVVAIATVTAHVCAVAESGFLRAGQLGQGVGGRPDLEDGSRVDLL